MRKVLGHVTPIAGTHGGARIAPSERDWWQREQQELERRVAATARILERALKWRRPTKAAVRTALRVLRGGAE